MWFSPGRASVRENICSKTLHTSAMVKDKRGGGQTEVQYMIVCNQMCCNEAVLLWHVEEVSQWRCCAPETSWKGASAKILGASCR